MRRRELILVPRAAFAALAVLSAAVALAGPLASSARADFPLPTPCDIPLFGEGCDLIGDAAGAVAGAAGDFVMKGVTTWVTNAAVWVTGKVGGLVEATTGPDLQAGWFEGQYGAMVAVAGALALLMLMLAVVQAVMRQDVWSLARSALGYLPLAFVLAGAAMAGTQLLIWITDDLASAVVQGLGSAKDNSLLNQVGDAYKHALDDNSDEAVPLFGIFLGAIILAIGAFVLWLELIIRDAAIYICVFFLPLTFVGMIWPATSRWARRLVELLVAVVLSKFVIVAILTLATAAIAGTVEGEGSGFGKMLAGAALLVLAAWSPFALLRLIPMMEVAAHSIGSQRAAVGHASAAAGIATPAHYFRQAMDRQSHTYATRNYETTAGGARPAPASSTTGRPHDPVRGATDEPGRTARSDDSRSPGRHRPQATDAGSPPTRGGRPTQPQSAPPPAPGPSAPPDHGAGPPRSPQAIEQKPPDERRRS